MSKFKVGDNVILTDLEEYERYESHGQVGTVVKVSSGAHTFPYGVSFGEGELIWCRETELEHINGIQRAIKCLNSK